MIPPLIIYILDMKHFRYSENGTIFCIKDPHIVAGVDDTALIVWWPFLLRN